jgi:hypothetical protein
VAAKLPSLRSLVGNTKGTSAPSKAALPSLSDVLGGGGGKGLPTLAQVVGGKQDLPAPAKKSGGGLLGKVESVAHTVEHGAQSGLGKVADVTASVGTGLYQLGALETSAIKYDVEHPNLGKHESFHDFLHGSNNPASHKLGQIEAEQGRQIVKSATSPSYIEHHPLTAGLNDLALLSGGLGAAGKVAYLGRVANAARVAETGDLVVEGSDAAKAAQAAGHTVTPLTAAEKTTLARQTLTRHLPVAERALNVPKLVAPEGEGPARLTHEPAQIGTAAQGALARTGQKLHDAIAQKALDNNVSVAKPSLTARYAERRVAGAVGESARVTRNVRNADVTKVTASARDLDKGVPSRVGELAMFLRSANVTGKEAADYWGRQAAAGVGGRVKLGRGLGQRQTAVLAKLAQRIHDQGLLTQDETGNVAVDAAKFPKLAHADSALQNAQGTRENILRTHDLMTDEGLQTRLDLVGQKMLGEDARPGQGFVTLRTAVGRSPQSPVSRARGPVIPLAKRLSVGKKATGAGVAKGLIPARTSTAVARGLHEALRFMNSDDLRGQVARYGSDVKRSGDDVLVRDPSADKAGGISEQMKQVLGTAESTVTEPSQDRYRSAGRELLEKAIPGLRDNYAADRDAALGTRATEGHKWVPKRLIPDELTTSVEARGKVEKFADAVNSAVTSATVYLKLGHLPTRLLTNLSTNAVQGSLSPGELRRSVEMADKLSDGQKLDLAAATGTHGYQALPHAGAGTIAKIASKGASAWARHIDAPFRLNAILYEMRQAGIDTPEAISKAIGQLKDPGRSGMSASEISKLDGAVRRANRASIMYDGLSAAEKRYVARYVWFYPWTKGAVRFAGHVVADHPVKAAAIGQIGQQGGAYRDQVLGPVPNYELGLTPFSNGREPLTGTLSSFTPFSTVGDVAQLAQHPLNKDQGVVGQLNPYYAAIATLASEAQAGKKHALSDALHEAVQPTPEAQIVNAYRHPPRPTQMFGPTPTGVHDPREASVISSLIRALGGAAVPRPTRRSELLRAALSQKR